MQSPEVTVALIGAFGLIGVALLQGLFTHRKATKLTSDLATNHGKRPGEYLEMVADVAVSQQFLAAKIDNVLDRMVQHDLEDESSFDDVRELIGERSEAINAFRKEYVDDSRQIRDRLAATEIENAKYHAEVAAALKELQDRPIALDPEYLKETLDELQSRSKPLAEKYQTMVSEFFDNAEANRRGDGPL